jgi:hypothetical protein
VTVRFRTFRKHRRPCGQPAVVGEIGRFRPVPPHAGHFIRINATPSDFPFKSIGFATYPEPPQFGQSSGATPSPPRVTEDCPPETRGFRQRSFCVTNPEQNARIPPPQRYPAKIQCKNESKSDTRVFTPSIPAWNVLDFAFSISGVEWNSKFQRERAGYIGSLKIFSIRNHFSPGFASGRAFWNLHMRSSHS